MVRMFGTGHSGLREEAVAEGTLDDGPDSGVGQRPEADGTGEEAVAVGASPPVMERAADPTVGAKVVSNRLAVVGVNVCGV
jgi:hypothetical protein